MKNLIVNLYYKEKKNSKGRAFPTYFVGGIKNGKAVFLDCKVTDRFEKQHPDIINDVRFGNTPVALTLTEAVYKDGKYVSGDYFIGEKKNADHVPVLHKDGSPIYQLVLLDCTSSEEAINLPKSEKPKVTADQFFD